ncbi:MAG: hypothetical protein H6981_01505 [Gammaproteobacteria bacterium]|nr:hypothetical protein [Gammaproteobacteria bacterium]MCP5135463.1 hypothetical protein [Gammaproteobacteria bacterium]
MQIKFPHQRCRARCTRWFSGLLFACAAVWSVHVAAADIRWDDTKLFQHHSVNEPVEELLRQILQQNGLSGIFLQGVRVKEPVSQEFDNIPLQAAFNKVLQENGLTYTYDEDKQTVTVAVATEVRTRFRLISPQYMSLADVENAFTRFSEQEPRLKAALPVFDYATQSVLLRGEPDQVNEVETLIQALDDGEKRRLESRKTQLQDRLTTRQLNKQVASTNLVMRVFPLRFSNVGESEVMFQGEKVSVPGIDEALLNLLDERPSVLGKEETLSTTSTEATNDGVGTLRISVDVRSNSVIARGTEEQVEEVASLLEQLDKPVPLIDLEVMIVQADAGVSRSLGVQWAVAEKDRTGRKIGALSTGPSAGVAVQSLADNALNAGTTTDTVVGSGGNTVTNTQQAVDPISLLPLNAVANLTASFIYNGPRTFIQAQLNALSSDNKAELISAPHVVALNNSSARITSTEKVHIPLQGGLNNQGSVEDVDAGLSLTITPSVVDLPDADKQPLVRMTINAQRSSFTQALRTQEKEIQTQVMLQDGATFMLGGLFESSRLEGEDGVPGLMDIPVIGALFRNRESLDQRAETIFFITPKIIEQERIMDQNIGVRDYIHAQRRRLRADERDLRGNSGLLPLSAELREDE